MPRFLMLLGELAAVGDGIAEKHDVVGRDGQHVEQAGLLVPVFVGACRQTAGSRQQEYLC